MEVSSSVLALYCRCALMKTFTYIVFTTTCTKSVLSFCLIRADSWIIKHISVSLLSLGVKAGNFKL